MAILKLFSFVIFVCLLLVYHSNAYSYDIHIFTSNKTFETVNGEFSLILDSFSLDSKIDEKFNYSNKM